MQNPVNSADVAGRTIRLLLLVLLLVAAPLQAAVSPAVVSAHPLATLAGEETLARGGNAFDAAIAVAAALAVVEPYGSGLGGGGFWLLHDSRTGVSRVLDARERAPLAARSDMYLGPDAKPRPRASLDGPGAAAIPGTPAALALIAEKYARLPLAASLAPAIRYAESGFVVDRRYLEVIDRVKSFDSGAAGIFLDAGAPPRAGFRLRQPALAGTLQALAREGRDGFYRGAVGRELVHSVRAAGGLWSEQDLERYQVVERSPLVFRYRGVRVTTVPPPSAGGIGLAQALGMLEALPFARARTAERAHFVIETLRRVYRDRARYLGDPDFVAIPVSKLLSKEYTRDLASTIRPDRASPSLPAEAPHEGDTTTHFAVVDAEGNRVAATLSINTWFGSGFVAGKTGVLLNNEMDDFAVDPGNANVYGLVGGAANAIAPGKRPLSSMTPTFVEDRRGTLLLGTPGGSRIVSMVLLAVVEYAHGTADPAKIVAMPRMHHQYLPDRLELEPGVPEWLAQALRAKGHHVQRAEAPWGNMQAIFVDRRTGASKTASDPRTLPKAFAPPLPPRPRTPPGFGLTPAVWASESWPTNLPASPERSGPAIQ